MKTFNIKEDKQIQLQKYGNRFEVNIGKYNIEIENIGSISSSGDCFKIYPNNFEHYCGYRGFRQSLNDSCPSCDENERRYNVLRAAYEHAKYRFDLI